MLNDFSCSKVEQKSNIISLQTVNKFDAFEDRSQLSVHEVISAVDVRLLDDVIAVEDDPVAAVKSMKVH